MDLLNIPLSFHVVHKINIPLSSPPSALFNPETLTSKFASPYTYLHTQLCDIMKYRPLAEHEVGGQVGYVLFLTERTFLIISETTPHFNSIAHQAFILGSDYNAFPDHNGGIFFLASLSFHSPE